MGTMLIIAVTIVLDIVTSSFTTILRYYFFVLDRLAEESSTLATMEARALRHRARLLFALPSLFVARRFARTRHQAPI